MWIIVVDDDPTILTSTSRMLRSMGHNTLTANTVDAACALLRTMPADVVLTDFNMPDKNGDDMARATRACHPNARVFLHSSAPEEATVRLYDRTVRKGDREDLLEAVREAVER